MAISCDPQSLDSAARCFICIPTGFKPVVNASLLNSISGANATPQSLIDLSKGFDSFQGVTSLGAEVYLLQQIAGLGSLSPSDLATAARCFDCGRDGDLSDMHTFLLASQAGGSIVPADLMNAARTYQVLFGMEWRVNLYLTCQWALMSGSVTSCDPAALLTASRCLTNCLPYYVLRAVRVYLLCFIVSGGMGSGNIIPPGSIYGPGAEFDLVVLPNTVYAITWGSNDLSVTICGVNYPSTGAGNTISVATGSCTLMQFFGTFAGTTVTARVHAAPAAIPLVTGFTLAVNGAGTLAVATWNNPVLAYVTFTELWTSTDGVTYSLAATVNFPTATASVTAPITGNILYAKVRYGGPGGTGDFNTILFVYGTIADWIKRVNTNGGGNPSTPTINAVTTFYNSIQSLLPKMIGINVFAPDNLITARTPLIVGSGGLDPWTVVTTGAGYVAGDLNNNGLMGTGNQAANSTYLDTGLIPSTVYPNDSNAGLTVWISQALDNVATLEGTMGCNNGGGTINIANGQLSAGVPKLFFSAWTNGNNGGTSPARMGYISGNVTAGNVVNIYVANAGTAHTALFSGASAGTRGPLKIGCLGIRDGIGAGTPSQSACRVGFAAVHQGLTAAESLLFSNAISTMRAAFQVSVVSDFATRVVANGGAAVSNATKTALTTFYNSLVSGNLVGKILTLNAIVPDNLTAARTPLLGGYGFDPWLNTAFIAGDLTVNGLAGNTTTKWMDTGVLGIHFPSAAAAGFAVYGASIVSNAAQQEIGYTNDTGSDSCTFKLDQGGLTAGDCFDLTAGGVSTGSQGSGYYCLTRVAANDLRVFYAKSTSAHAQLGATFAGANGSLVSHHIYAWCTNHWNAGNTPLSFSPSRLSIICIHSGFTATDSSNFFNACQALRTALGGGFV